MARKYQGHARRTNFQRRDPGYQSLNRMQQQGDRVIRGLEEDRQEQLRNEQNYARSLDNNFERAQQNRQELFQLQSRIDDNRMQAERNVARQRVRDAEIQQRNVETANRQLSQFSQTLAKTAIAAGKKADEIKTKAAFSTQVLDASLETFKPSEEYNQGLELLEQREEAYQQVGDGMTGVSEATVQQFRSDSPTRALGALDGRLQMASQLVDSRLTSYSEAPVQLYDLMDEFALHDVHRHKLYDFAKKVQARRATLFAAESKVRAKELSFERVLEKQNRFLAEPTAKTFDDMVKTISRGTSDGVSRNGMSYAIKQELGSDGLLGNPALIDNATFDRIVKDNTYPGAQGNKTSIEARFPGPVKLLRQSRADKEISNSNRIDKLTKAESATKRRSLEQQMTEAAQAGEYAFDAFTEAIQRSDLTDDDKKLAQEFNFDASPRGQVEEELLVEIRYRHNNGQEIEPLVARLRGPEKAKWQDITNKEKEALSDPRIPSATDAKNFFVQSARNVLSKEKTVSADGSFKTAGSDAYFQYLERRKRYMDDGMDGYDAHVQAQGEMLTLLQSGTGKFVLSTEGADKPVSFSYYTPEGGYYQDIVKKNGAEALRLVRDNPEALDTTYLVSEDVLEERYKALRENRPTRRAFVFQTLEEIGVHGAEQRQLNLYIKNNNLEPVTVPMSAKQYLSETSQSPRVKRFMETAYKPIDYHKAPLVRSESSYRDPSLMSRAVREMYPMIQIPAVEGGITGLTVQDYHELAYIVSREAERGTDDEFAVAASVLNRLASGKYGDSIYDIARSPGQYEAVTLGNAQYDAALAKRLSSPEGQRSIRQALVELDGRTEYKGQDMMQFRDSSDPMFSSNGNFFHYAGQTPGSGSYTGTVDRSFERFYN